MLIIEVVALFLVIDFSEMKSSLYFRGSNPNKVIKFF